MQRLADAGDIAMAEDRPDTAEDRGLLAVDHGHLLGQKPRDGLRHRQANGLAHRAPPAILVLAFLERGTLPRH
jgi:hypothetical protein